LETALDAAGAGHWTWTADRFRWDARCRRLLHASRAAEEETVAALLERLDEGSRQALRRALSDLENGAERIDLVISLLEPRNGPKLRLVGQVHGDGPVMRLSGLCLPLSPGRSGEGSKSEHFAGRWRDLIAVSSDICVEIDFDGRILTVNPATESTLGYDLQAMAGRSILDFIHPADIAKTRELTGQIVNTLGSTPVTNTIRLFENRYRCCNGSYRWFSWSWMADPETRRVYGIARDVTHEKESRERQDRLLDHLTRSNRDLENFASVASHDLREPLRMITGYLKLLEERYPDALDEKGRKYVRHACDGANRMRQLIEDLLAYSRINSQPLEPVPVALDQVIRLAAENLRETIAEAGAELSIESAPDAVIEGDPIRLTRLFQNLIGNGIKFQKGGNPARVDLRVRSETGPSEHGGWLVQVGDNGIGIDPDHRDLLFQLFRRLNTRDEFEGSGIGLAVCKRIVDMHEGKIWFESEKGRGSTFFVWLKRAADPAA